MGDAAPKFSRTSAFYDQRTSPDPEAEKKFSDAKPKPAKEEPRIGPTLTELENWYRTLRDMRERYGEGDMDFGDTLEDLGDEVYSHLKG